MALQNFAWQLRERLSAIGKQRGKIIVPAFSAVCGIPVVSLYTDTGGAVDTNTPAAFDLTAALTLEGWVKINVSTSLIQVIMGESNLNYSLVTNANGYLVFSIYKAGLVSVTSNLPAPVSEWFHVAGTWDGVAMKLYVNGQLQAQTQALAAPADVRDGPTMTIAFCQSYGSANFNEIRIWNYARSIDQIDYSRFSPRDITGTIDVGLIGYWKINEGAGLSINNSIAANVTAFTFPVLAGIHWDTTTRYPYKLWASFIPALFDANTNFSCAFKVPVNRPTEDCNFVLAVSYVDTLGIGETTRYYFWTVAGIAIPNATLYTGQALSKNFTLEAWNFDGNVTIDLASDITLYTSSRRVVTELDFNTINVDDNLTINTALGTTYNLQDPMIFNTQPVY